MKHGRKTLEVAVIVGLLVSVGLFAAEGEEAPKQKLDMAEVSYCIGLSIGQNMKGQQIELDVDTFLEGLRAGLSGKASRMNADDMERAMKGLEQRLMKRQMEQSKRLGEENLQSGKAFLEENRKKEGVKVLPSGLQYKVLRAGGGKQPGPEDTVTVHYRGTLTDGTEFDSSYKRGEPATFPVKGVIAGWTEALQLMKEGAKWQLFIPAELAYGQRGAGRVIGPNAVLIFEVELTKVK